MRRSRYPVRRNLCTDDSLRVRLLIDDHDNDEDPVQEIPPDCEHPLSKLQVEAMYEGRLVIEKDSSSPKDGLEM